MTAKGCNNARRYEHKYNHYRTYLVWLVALPLFAPFASLAQSRLLTVANQQSDAAALSGSFRCPETYSSAEAKKAALDAFIRSYLTQMPQSDVRDMMLFRYHLLVTHSCIQTLNSMLTQVGPSSEMLRINNQDFGPKSEEYDPRTRVWSVWFRKDGETPALSEADLIFNFYQWTGSTPESVAHAFMSPRRNMHILGSFEAPDDITRKPAFIIVSEAVYPDENYGYVNVSKISSNDSGTYTVTLTHKMSGSSSMDVDKKAAAWFLSDEGQSISRIISHIGIDSSWQQYFANKHN